MNILGQNYCNDILEIISSTVFSKIVTGVHRSVAKYFLYSVMWYTIKSKKKKKSFTPGKQDIVDSSMW